MVYQNKKLTIGYFCLGKIVTMRVLVIHITHVQPLAVVCTYITDNDDGNVKTLFQVVRSMSFRLYTEVE